MYSTPAVVMTSSSWMVYTALGLPTLPCGISESALLQLRALIAWIDQPKVFQHLCFAVGLDLGEVDRQWRMVLFVHFNGPARPLEHDRGQGPENGIRLRGARLLDGHGIRVHAVVFLLRKRVRRLQLRSKLLLHRVEESFVFRIVDTRVIVPRVVHTFRRVAARFC